VFDRFPSRLRETVIASPELFLPVFLLFTWRVTALVSGPRTFILALLSTGILVIYAFRVLGRNAWLIRLGWASPRRGFWLWSILAGLGACGTIGVIARLSHQSLGVFPRFGQLMLASTAGPMVEEILFRGLMFWGVIELFRRIRVPERPGQVIAILLIAFSFALAHIGRVGISFACTALTGAAFGAMRVWSQSTAAAALMHSVYNFALCWMTLA
jgi:membrane protease YdiL (CAAX protease family)